jgi:hypothetical protein
MRKLVLSLAAVAAVSFCVKFTHAADDSGKTQKVTGVLIDEKCAAKFTSKDDPEKAAAGHSAKCAAGCAAKGSPLVLLSGKDEIKLDDKGQELGKEYLGKDGASTKVVITGEKEGDHIKVTSIDPESK